MLYKIINGIMSLFCVVTLYSNYTKVNILNNTKAISQVGNDTFEYESNENSFKISRNGKLVGMIPTKKRLNFTNYIPKLNCTALVVGVKATVVASTAAAAGGNFFAAMGSAFVADVGTICGAAATTGTAVAGTVTPGAAALSATLGGAGEVAAAAAATEATVGGAALVGGALAAVGGAMLIGGLAT